MVHNEQEGNCQYLLRAKLKLLKLPHSATKLSIFTILVI